MFQVDNDLRGVLGGIDLQVGFRDFTLRIDQERVALGKTRHHPVGVGAVALGDEAFAVGQAPARLASSTIVSSPQSDSSV